MSFNYSQDVYNTISAKTIFPDLFNFLKPKSILDIGCGIGTWLKVAKELGVLDVVGIDGDYVDRSLLLQNLKEEEFLATDLSFPFQLDRQFDLVICLEVAEHLKESSADTLITSLTCHSDAILFSAAIPFQGGQNHLNEQPPQYWIEKFEQHGYQVYDPIRPLVWDSPEVDVWYKQNMFLFSKKTLDLPVPAYKHIVHPELFEAHQLKNFQYQNELNILKTGQGKSLFYLKRFFQSLVKSIS
jgi:SAM-dependent methyltransferase